MPRQSVVILGSLPVDTVPLERLVAEFGWSLAHAASFSALRNLNAEHELVAVLFEASMWKLDWDEALKMVQDAAPRALPLVCYRFSDTSDWPDLADAGAFHRMRLPLTHSEARQSLGFVWAAKRATEKSSPRKAIARPARVA